MNLTLELNRPTRLINFRLSLHASFKFRADALFELIDALLLSPGMRAVIELSLSPTWRRRFASVYDALRHGQLDREQLRKTFAEAEPPDALTVEGYAIYAVDSTPHPRPDAKTLPDRGAVYVAERNGTVAGHQFSWLGRIIARGSSWFAAREVDRIPTHSTPAAVGGEQVSALAATNRAQPKVVVGDSHYAHKSFLKPFSGLSLVHALVRLACNRVLYKPPAPKSGKPGRPAVHGPKFSLKHPGVPERQAQFNFRGQSVRLSAWGQLHFKWLPALVGLALRVEFLKADGTPRYARPLWLFWSGPADIALSHLATMYLLRFGIEHFFRFLKQHLGLLAMHSTDLIAVENWVWVVALAYWQLLLARDGVSAQYHPWDPTARRDPTRPLTPGQVRQAWAVFSRGLGTPATVPSPAGKGPGRVAGFHPKPRPAYPVITQKAKQAAAAV